MHFTPYWTNIQYETWTPNIQTTYYLSWDIATLLWKYAHYKISWMSGSCRINIFSYSLQRQFSQSQTNRYRRQNGTCPENYRHTIRTLHLKNANLFGYRLLPLNDTNSIIMGSGDIDVPKKQYHEITLTHCGQFKLYRIIEFVQHHDDVIKWKHFPRYWPFMYGIHRSPVNSPHKGQCRGDLVFSLICAWMNRLVNKGKAGDLRRHGARYGVTNDWSR